MKKRPETRDQITLIGMNYKAEKALIENGARHSKTCSTHVIWSLVSFISTLDMETGFRLCYLVSGLWSLSQMSDIVNFGKSI